MGSPVRYPSIALLAVIPLGLLFAGEQRGRLRLTGQDLPRHVAVEAFFNQAFTAYRAGEQAFAFNVLKPLGIEPGSKADEALSEALLLAQALLKETLRADAVPAADFDVEQQSFRIQRASQLGQIYGALLADLRDFGLKAGQVDRFIEQQIAPGTFYFITSSSDAETHDSGAAPGFEAALEKLEAVDNAFLVSEKRMDR